MECTAIIQAKITLNQLSIKEGTISNKNSKKLCCAIMRMKGVVPLSELVKKNSSGLQGKEKPAICVFLFQGM